MEGIGGVIAGTIRAWFADERNMEALNRLVSELAIEKETLQAGEQMLDGKVFVITGSVHHFSNRNEVKAKIESLGGKVTGSVSAKTDYLINNDTASSSSKNKKAKELSIPIISEVDFLAMIGEHV